MGLRDEMIALSLEDRFSYDSERNVFYVNFESLAIRSHRDVQRIRARVRSMLTPLGKWVKTIVNGDSFSITPERENAYVEMV